LDKLILKGFVDDVNIHNQTRLQEVNLKLNLGKCSFGAQKIIFLGHVVTKQGSYPDPKKVQDVKDFPIPRSVTNVRAFFRFDRIIKNLCMCVCQNCCATF